jgi:hypothetical protein
MTNMPQNTHTPFPDGSPPTRKEELGTAIIHVRQSWVETTGSSAIFASATVALGRADTLGIPVTRWDISDEYIVELPFYPRALQKEPVKSIKVLIPEKGSSSYS